MVTAYSKHTLQQQSEAAFINGVLTKPVLPSCLFNALLYGKILNLPPVTEQEILKFDGIRVLLAEDNALNQEVAANIIKNRGATLTIAGNGQEAVDLVQRQVFDLALIDLHMPVMGGIEATRQIRKLEHGKNLPIVAMTAAVMAEDRESCLAIGMVDFISKPVEPEDIVRVLRTYTRPKIQEYMPVLDLVKGLNRLEGNQALQYRLLRNFVECYHDFSQRLDKVITEKKVDKAIEMIHAVKGVAANLGAIALAESSQCLIEELRHGALLTTRTSFDAILVNTIHSIENYVQTSRIKTTGTVANSLQDTLLLLEPFIIGQEVIADEILFSLQQFADGDSPHSCLLLELQHQIDNFQFTEALATLNLLKTNLLEQ